jgi:hypothetical protein
MFKPSVPNITVRPVTSPNSIEFYWDIPADNGGFPISTYMLWCSSASISSVMNPSTYYTKVSSLINGRDYIFQLSASNKNGYGPYATFRTVQPGSIPGGVTGVGVSTINTSTVNVVWNFSTNTGEAATKWFLITGVPSTLTGGSISTIVKSVHGTERGRDIQNISSANYTFIVQAINDAGYAFPNASTQIYVGPSLTVNPLIFSNLMFWLDGTDPYGTGIAPAISSILTTWKDKSVNAVTPTIIGGDATGITYGGSTIGTSWSGNSYLSLPTGALPSGNSPFTHFMAFSPENTNNITMINIGNTNSQSTQLSLQLRGTDIVFSKPDLTTMVPRANQPTLVSIDYYSSFAQRQIIINTYSTNTQSAPAYNLPSTLQYIGASYDGSQIFKGKYYEVMTFAGALVPYERQVIEGYLAWKWNFTSNLPNNHPFKTAAPKYDVFLNAPKITPEYINGMQLWIDGADPLGNGTLPADGTALLYWYDKSGFARIMTFNNLPTFTTNVANGKSAIFMGGWGTTNIPAQTFIAALDVFVVYKYTATEPSYPIIFDRTTGPLHNGGGTISNFSNYVSVSNGGANAIYPPFIYTTNLRILNCKISQATIQTSFYEHYINGTLQTPISGSAPANFTPYDDSTNFNIASARSGTSFTGYICEVLVYNVYLSAGQRQLIEGFLAWKWGLQASLPPGHPYLSAAPSILSYAGP